MVASTSLDILERRLRALSSKSVYLGRESGGRLAHTRAEVPSSLLIVIKVHATEVAAVSLKHQSHAG